MSRTLIIGLAALLSAPVSAADIPLPAVDATTPVIAPLALVPVTLPEPSPFDVDAIDDRGLARVAGREDVSQVVMTAQTRNNSTVSNNSVSGTSVTGGITFDGAALQNLSGLTVLSANTGNNVSINAAMNVNVAIRP